MMSCNLRADNMEKKKKRATIARPTPNSRRSKRREKRGFKSLETSSRKHRRALRRMNSAATIGQNHVGTGGQWYKPGTKVDPPTQGKTKTFAAVAGGALKYHC